MIHPADRDRQVVPRWRRQDDALDAHLKPEAGPVPRLDVRKREEEWTRTPTRGTALELVSVAATTASPSPVAHEAAQWLLSRNEPSTLARRMAQLVLGSRNREQDATEPELTADSVRAEVRRLRNAAHEDNRNALAWVELSRMYVLLGQVGPSHQAMQRGIAAAPYHRHVLRAATRLHVHFGDPEAAHNLLSRNPRTSADPWLMASEISVAALSARTSRLLGPARLLLGAARWSHRDLTELASAVGTAELEAGRGKRARDLFRVALQDPNDNSLAQAEWAADRVPSIRGQLEPALAQTPRSWEAHAKAAASQGDHSRASEHAWLWLLDQPFSSEAAVFGSYQAAITKNFQLALEFAVRGLMSNPRHQTLLNNAAFAAAKMDRPGEAQMYLDRWTPNESAHDRAFYLATQGLIALRSRDLVEGQRLYEMAVEAAPDGATRTRARLMLLSELVRLHLPDLDGFLADIRREARANLARSEQSWLDHLSE